MGALDPGPDICHVNRPVFRQLILHTDLHDHIIWDPNSGNWQIEHEIAGLHDGGLAEIRHMHHFYPFLLPGILFKVLYFLFSCCPDQHLSAIRALLRLHIATEKEMAVVTYKHHFNHLYPKFLLIVSQDLPLGKSAPTEGGFFTIYRTIYAPFLRLLEKVPCEYAGHTPRFQSLVYHLLRWAWERGLFPDITEDEIGLIASLSAYHDVGKSMLPPTLLYKEGPLTPKELEMLKTHPEWGEFLVDLAIPELRGTTTHRCACEICRWHHERWDGGGYPDGLKGNEIPRYVQVVALADAYDALVAPRSYKPPIQHRPLCEKLGGLYLRMSPSSKDCPNLMAIRRASLDSYAHLKNLTARDDSVLADKISRLIIWFSLKKRDLNEEDKSRLDSSLVECYQRYGINFDNHSLLDGAGEFKEMPILADWYDVLQKNPETKHLAVVLARYVTGSAAAMGGRNDISLDNKFIVLDISGLSDDMIADGTFWATDVAYDLIMNAGSELSALLADELWSLVGASSNPQAAGFVLEMVKTIRGLGGIAVTSTQGMQDLFGLEGGKYGKGILDSSRIKLIMQMEEQEARLIQEVLNLSEDEVRQITRFRRGEGLLCIGYNHVPIAFHASQQEYDIITTSPTDLHRRAKEVSA